MRRALFLMGALLLGCPKPAAPARTDGWVRVKDDVYRNGDAFVYVLKAKRDLERGLPGIAFGGASGPRFGLLGGYYAPQLLAPDSALDYEAEVQTGEVLRVRLAHEDGPGLAVDVALTPKHAVEARVIGSAVIAAPADRTEVQGFLGDRPSFLTEVSSGDEAQLVTPRADVLEVVARDGGRWRIEAACPRSRLLRPRPTGSTSVFLLAVGPDPLLTDSVYTTEGADARHADFDACGRSATSTITFARTGG